MKVQEAKNIQMAGYNKQIVKTANMSNEEILQKSYEAGCKNVENKASTKILKALPTLAVSGVAIANGILTKGKFSNKVKGAAYSLGAFAAVSVIYDCVRAGLNKAEEKSGTIKQIDEKNPMLAALTQLGILFGTSALALKGAKYGAKRLIKRFPSVAQEYKKVSKNIASIIDKSKLSGYSDRAMEALQKVAKKHPKLSSFAKNYSFVIMIAGYLGLSTLLMAKAEKDKQKAAYAKAEELTTQRQLAQHAIERAKVLNTTNV